MIRTTGYDFKRAGLHLLFAGVTAALVAVPQALELVDLDPQVEVLLVGFATALASFVRTATVAPAVTGSDSTP